MNVNGHPEKYCITLSKRIVTNLEIKRAHNQVSMPTRNFN